ncbi:hypothetical protein [Caulobacter sp. 17J80-11]|uniref:hypothetical protein n=1 Tax=Caulobacter sp. 17J80-11 TaxID=2763502 RepID=UPI0016538FBA|nr:hypothetical protein [Caulobacter sp. 17J80-11]MBC6983614.1 hypothetical protein [Caulobacter sp. 17J80-11]
MRAYLAEVAVWSTAIQQSLQEQSDAFVEVLDGADVALDFYDRRAKRDGRTWAKTWGAEQEQAWAAMGAKLDAAASAPPPVPPAFAAADASFAKMTRALNDLPEILRRDFEKNRILVGRIIPQVQATAGGDKRAAEGLVPELLNVSIAIAEAENELGTATTAFAPADHPQRHLVSASQSTNLALIELLTAEQAVLLSKPVDEAALAARLREYADASEVAAAKVEANATRLLAEVRGTRVLAGTELLVTAERALATYKDSADVERLLVNVLREMATRIEAPGEVDWQTLLPSLEQLEALASQRVAIDLQRRQGLQGA